MHVKTTFQRRLIPTCSGLSSYPRFDSSRPPWLTNASTAAGAPASGARVSSNFKLLDCIMAFYVFSLDSFSVNFHHNIKHTSTIAFVLCSVSALFLPAMLEWSNGPWRWHFECVNIVSTNLFSTRLRTQERTRPQFQHHFWWPQNRCTGSLGASKLHWPCGRTILFAVAKICVRGATLCKNSHEPWT